MNERVAYSTAEMRLLTILKERRPKAIDTKELCDLYYDGKEGRKPPYHAESSIRSMLNGLMRKVNHNGEPYSIVKSNRGGPYPIEFKIVRQSS